MPLHSISTVDALRGGQTRTFDLSIVMKNNNPVTDASVNPKKKEKVVSYEFSLLDSEEQVPLATYSQYVIKQQAKKSSGESTRPAKSTSVVVEETKTDVTSPSQPVTVATTTTTPVDTSNLRRSKRSTALETNKKGWKMDDDSDDDEESDGYEESDSSDDDEDDDDNEEGDDGQQQTDKSVSGGSDDEDDFSESDGSGDDSGYDSEDGGALSQDEEPVPKKRKVTNVSAAETSQVKLKEPVLNAPAQSAEPFRGITVSFGFDSVHTDSSKQPSTSRVRPGSAI